MKNKQVTFGALFSYILIILNAVYGLFLTPFIVSQIGEASYGVYKTISSFSSALMVLDLGLGGTMMRYIAKYRADKEDEKIPNFLFMGGCQTAAIVSFVGIITFVLYFFIDNIYANGLTSSEISIAQNLYIYLALGILAHIIENFLNGIISGYNKFIFANGIKIVRLLVRILAIIVFLTIFKNPIVLVAVDLFCTVFFTFIEIIFLKYSIKVKIKFSYWDKSVFSESFRYTILMFLTSIVAQANSNFSNIAIGAFINSTAVTVFSMAILIFGMYEQLSTAISGVMLPTITNTLKNDDEKYSKTINVVTQTGRIQFILLGAVFSGFIVLGKPFLDIWLGAGYEDVYFLTLILLCPALLELCINVCLSILRAKNILGFRTVVIFLSAILNLLITFTTMPYIGYYSAAIGIASSFLFGSVITMGVFYYKKLKINILTLYKNIFKNIWICIILSSLGAFAVSKIPQTSFLKFLFGFVVYILIYSITLLLFGLNKNEKNKILNIFRRKRK